MASDNHGTRWLTPARETLALLFLLVLAGLLYLPGVNGPFLHDDFARIVGNERVEIETLDVASLARSTLEYPSRPLSMATFAANHAACGPEPACYKVPNVLLHLATAIALWFFLAHLRLALQLKGGPAIPPWLPLVATALWIVHPLNVSTVLYAIQRMTQMAMLFSLIAMAGWLQARFLSGSPLSRTAWLLISVIALALGVLSKESAWLVIPLLALTELLLLPEQLRKRFQRPAVMGWTFTVGGFALLWLLAEQPPAFIDRSYLSREFTPPERLLTEARILFYYFSEIVWPDPGRMSIYLDTFALSKSLFSPPTTLFAVMACLIAIGWSLSTLLARSSLVAYGILFFFLGHAIESSVIGLVLAYEHRNYFPVIGLLLAGTSLIPAMAPGIRAAITATLIGMLAFLLATRVETWSTEESFVDFLRSPRWENSLGANIDIARHFSREARKYQDDPMLRRVYEKQVDTYFFKAAQSTSQPFLPLANLVARPAPPAEMALYWDMLDEAARSAPINMNGLNATSWMAVCLLAPECPISRERYARYLDLVLANPRMPSSTRRKLERVAGTFFTRIQGETEKGLLFARKAARTGDAGARESLVKNLAFAGRTEEAVQEYRAMQQDFDLSPGQVQRMESAIANPGVILP